ncbi:CHAT domain-containing protein [Nostoc sp.]|uniref:CHAT domain-containing protein n=1 Tax=Nostoc sp. TaxID=1180 RepID=UPI002FFA903C
MDEERQKAYLTLINSLFNSPSGKANSILNANSVLIDAGLVQTMEQVASLMTEQGYQNAADFLMNVACQLSEIISSSRNVTDRTVDEGESLAKTKQEEYLIFLDQVYQATAQSDSNPQVVYPLLAENLEKLNDDFAFLLRQVIIDTLTQVEPEQAQSIAAVIGNFSDLMREFPQGDRASNLEIAIAGAEVAATVFTHDAYPNDWATNRNNLAAAYTKRVRGDREENLERAIAAHEEALQVYTQSQFPTEWARTQSNLGNAYSDRIRSDRTQNLERAIRCYLAAEQVRTQEAFPYEWATTQNNLGAAYWNRIEGERGQNLELAIAAFQAALEVYTQQAFPEDWARIQNNLGVAYRDRIQGEQRANLEAAIAHFQAALQVYTQTAFPQYWATIQNNLGAVYLELEQISAAISSFRSALEIYTPSAFPLECFGTGQNFGNTARACQQWADAIEGYHVAIEAVEQSRTWAITDTRRQEILSGGIDVYANIVKAYIKTNHPDQALEYVERSKARNLVDTLSSRDIYPKGNISETIINELKRSRQEIVAEQRRLDMIEQNRSSSMGQLIGDSDSWLKNRTRLNELLQQLNHLIKNEIDPIDPSFRATQQVKPISYSEIETLVDDRTTIVEWYICNDNFHTFIITHSSEHPLVWSSSAEEIQALMDWQNEYLQDYQQNRKQWIEKLPESLQSLAIILHIDEIINYLPSNCDQLILIPHRFLHLIPLHALPLSPNTHLLDHFSRGVRYAPSCQLLQLTGKQLCSDFNRLLAIQNPTKDLGHSAVEVKSIQNCFAHTDTLIENAATKAALIEINNQDDGTREVIQNSQLNLANCVHFSCHAEFNFESPLESALLLANKERITLGEIFDLDLPQCCLVTLSACETGLTNYKILSDEYIGISSSFIYAGSPSVVSSLWTVQDVSTAFLMIKFYQNLRTVLSVAVALNQAQIWLRNISKKELQIWIAENQIQLDATLSMSLRRRLHNLLDDDKPFQSPFHWAGFSAVGQ